MHSDNNGILESFELAVHGANGALEHCGFIFARYLEWMRRAPTVSGIGERTLDSLRDYIRVP